MECRTEEAELVKMSSLYWVPLEYTHFTQNIDGSDYLLWFKAPPL